jgi:hypothetical protein
VPLHVAAVRVWRIRARETVASCRSALGNSIGTIASCLRGGWPKSALSRDETSAAGGHDPALATVTAGTAASWPRWSSSTRPGSNWLILQPRPLGRQERRRDGDGYPSSRAGASKADKIESGLLIVSDLRVAGGTWPWLVRRLFLLA